MIYLFLFESDTYSGFIGTIIELPAIKAAQALFTLREGTVIPACAVDFRNEKRA